MKRLVIPKGTSLVRIQLEIKKPVDYRSYRAALVTAEGKELWSRTGLRAQATGARQSITVSLPARILPEGDYELTITGVASERNPEDVASYYFTVVKKIT